MDTEYYLTIIIEGINDEVNSAQLDVYLERKFQKLSNKEATRKEFIKGCEIALHKLEAFHEKGLNEYLLPQNRALNEVMGKGDGTEEKEILDQVNQIKNSDPFIPISGVNGFGLNKRRLEKVEIAINQFRGLHPDFILWGMDDLITDFDLAYEIRLDYFLKQNNTLSEKEFKKHERRNAKELQRKYFYDETDTIHRKYFHLLKRWRRYLKKGIKDSLEGEDQNDTGETLNLKHLALIAIYNEMGTDEESIKEMISSQGYSSIQKFKRHHDTLKMKMNRQNDSGSKRKLSYLIREIEKVKPLLKPENQHKADEDLQSLYNHLDSYT